MNVTPWQVFVGLAFITAVLIFTPVGSVLVNSFASLARKIRDWARVLLGREIPAPPEESEMDEYGQDRTRFYKEAPGIELETPYPLAKNAKPDFLRPSLNPKDRSTLSGEDSLRRMGFGHILPLQTRFLIVFLVLPWIGQWMFWAGFIQLASHT